MILTKNLDNTRALSNHFLLLDVQARLMVNQGNFQKTDAGGKTQDICQELAVTSGHTKAYFSKIFQVFLKTQQHMMVYAIISSSNPEKNFRKNSTGLTKFLNKHNTIVNN